MEELNMANQMLNWAATKAKANSLEQKKLERNNLVNKYAQMQFVPKTFEQRHTARKKEIPEYPL